MNNKQEENKLGQSLKRAAEDLAGKSTGFTKEILYNLASQYVTKKATEKQKMQKIRSLLYVLPAAAVLAVFLFLRLPVIQISQHNSTAQAVLEYAQSILPAQVNWVHDSITSTQQSTYIDKYVETILSTEAVLLYF